MVNVSIMILRKNPGITWLLLILSPQLRLSRQVSISLSGHLSFGGEWIEYPEDFPQLFPTLQQYSLHLSSSPFQPRNSRGKIEVIIPSETYYSLLLLPVYFFFTFCYKRLLNETQFALVGYLDAFDVCILRIPVFTEGNGKCSLIFFSFVLQRSHDWILCVFLFIPPYLFEVEQEINVLFWKRVSSSVEEIEFRRNGEERVEEMC